MTRTPPAEPGMVHRYQQPLITHASVEADQSPTALWQDIVNANGFAGVLKDAVREQLARRDARNGGLYLFDEGITLANGGYSQLLTGLDLPPESDQHQLAIDVTAQLGSGEVTVLGRRFCRKELLGDLDEGPLAVIEGADVTPIISVTVSTSFLKRRRDHREGVLELLNKLAEYCRIAVCCSKTVASWLADNHRELIPPEFNEHCNAGTNELQVDIERIREFNQAIDKDSREYKVLAGLADETSSVRSVHAIRSNHEVTDSRISQVLSQLEADKLVEKFGTRGNQHVELTPLGKQVIEYIEKESARQQRLNSKFRDSGHSSYSAVYSRTHTKGTAGPHHPYRTAYMARHEHMAAVAAGKAADIVPITTSELADDLKEHHTRLVSYDDDRGVAVVGVTAKTPLQYITSTALALASPGLLNSLLADKDVSDLDEPPAILRDARCIGALSNKALSSNENLRDALVKWGIELEEMTTAHHHAEYDDRDRYRSQIMRTAHGLAGSIIHLLDAFGINIVRELRLPSLTTHQYEKISRTISITTAIQSRYGVFATYRQLFEQRDEKRQAALFPQVDAADPVGTLIGSIVIRGPGADQLVEHTVEQIEHPKDLHENAPEIAVELTASRPGRDCWTETVSRMLKTKNIRATPQAITLYQTFAANLYAAAESVHWLGKGDDIRRIRLSELRVSLSKLESDQLLEYDLPPSVKSMTAALLRSTSLTRSELADEAGVSSRTVRRHLGKLEALGLITASGEKLRLALPSTDNFSSSPVPEALDDKTITLLDIAFGLALEYYPVDDVGRLGNPEDDVGRLFFYRQFSAVEFIGELPALTSWIELAIPLCDLPVSVLETADVIQFGSPLSQTSLQDALS